VPESTAKSESKDWQQFGQRATFRPNHHADAKLDAPSAALVEQYARLFPVGAQLAEKAMAAWGRLTEPLVASVSIPSGCGSLHEHLGRSIKLSERCREMFGCLDPAAPKYFSPRCGPSSISNTSASEMHDSVQAFKPWVGCGDCVG